MSYNKNELLTLPLDERKELASNLIDSILADQTKPVPAWKKELIQERMKYHNGNPGNGVEWIELEKAIRKMRNDALTYQSSQPLFKPC